MISQANAYEFVQTAFEHEAISKRIAKLGRGDVDALVEFACRLGFKFSPYDLAIALEWHIREMLESQDVAQGDLVNMLGVDDWEATLHKWQSRFQTAA